MNQYPKWLLALSFPNVFIPIGTLIFFLFGGVTLFDTQDSTLLDILQYIALQLFWVLPLASFFATLFLWGNTHERAAIITTIVGLLISFTSVFLLWSQRNETQITKPVAHITTISVISHPVIYRITTNAL
jgi:fumarate reductase subunit D